MLATHRYPAAPCRYLTLCGLALLLLASRAAAAEPSQAMLGVIPTDEKGQVIVRDVYMGGPAQLAGLHGGERIIAINDKPVNSSAELIAALSGLAPNTRIELRASRDGWVKQLSIELGKREDVMKLPLGRDVLEVPAEPRPRPRPVAPRGPSAEKIRELENPFYRLRNQRW